MSQVRFVRLWGRLIGVPVRADAAAFKNMADRLQEVERRGVSALPVASFTSDHRKVA